MSQERPRRVLHVLKFYRPDFTGEGVFLERSSAVMQEIAPGVEHELLVTLTPDPGTGAADCSTLVRVTYLTRRRLRDGLHELVLLMWFLRNLWRFDAVHFRTHADWYFLSYLLTRLAGRRLVLSATLDDSVPVLVNHYRPSLRGLAARGLALFHHYVAISPKLQAENRSVIAEADRCHLIACGVTVPPDPPGGREALRAGLGIGPGDPVMVFVGGLCERKDPRFLIEAMPAILAVHPAARLLLVGPPLEPGYVAEMRALAMRTGIAHAIVFAGQQADPHPWFAAADILVFASRLEGFGTVVPEAMAHRLPVVARRLPGVNDGFVLPGQTGFLFDDMPQYLDAVLRLLADAPLRAAMGEAGCALATHEFGMRQVAARYLGIYGLAAQVQLPPAETPETALGCTASIPDLRFHADARVDLPAATDTPWLITMIDAEEAFDWSSPFSRAALDVSSMRSQHLAHRVFERHGVIPVYMTDYPVAAQDAGRAPLRELLQGGHCDLGAQLHPWVTPPFTEAVSALNSFAGNLPPHTEYAKAEALTLALEESFGIRPRIYRTGRFGVGPRTADILKRLGYLADSSVAPCWPTAVQRQGVDPWTAKLGPYWVDRERTLLEIPVSAALVGHLAARWEGRLAAPAARLVFRKGANRLRLPGIAARLGLIERIRLTPEGMTVEEAKRLVRTLRAGGQRIFVLTYHSPSLEPGNTPYVRDLAQRERFLAWLDEFYTFFREEMGGRSATWREVRSGVAQATAAPRPAPMLEPAQ